MKKCNLRIVAQKQLLLLAISVILFAGMTGCSRNNGPSRYEISGQVTLDGKPAPLGEIFFQPDSSKGNRGPGATVRVEKGKFKTREGKGVSSGPHLVNIVAFDGIPNESSMDGNPLTTKTYVTTINIPESNLEQNFDVPTTHLVKK